MARTSEVRGASCWIAQQTNCGGAIFRAHAGSNSVARMSLNTHRESGAAGVVARWRKLKLKPIANHAVKRDAQIAATDAC